MREKDRWYFMWTIDDISCRRYLGKDSLKNEGRKKGARKSREIVKGERERRDTERERDSLKKVERYEI